MALQINSVESVPKSVTLLWPKPDTRIPAAKRPKPVLEGALDCEFVYHAQDDIDLLDGMVEAGEMTVAERFAKLVPVINGLPVDSGETAHQWLERHQYGAVVRAAIFEEYWTFVGEGRQGNSAKRRLR